MTITQDEILVILSWFDLVCEIVEVTDEDELALVAKLRINSGEKNE
jgi:hypothetical protein